VRAQVRKLPSHGPRLVHIARPEKNQPQVIADTGTDFHTGAQIVIVARLQGDIGKEAQSGITPHCGKPAGAGNMDPGLHLAKIKPWNDGDIKAYVPAHSVYDTHELAPRPQSPARPHREEIDELRHAGTRGESRNENQTVAAILALHPVWADRSNRKVTTFMPVEQPTEAAVGVKAW
jgi:hypothetical protein